jgi:hypothetical protein
MANFTCAPAAAKVRNRCPACPAGLVSAVESGAWIGEQATASGWKLCRIMQCHHRWLGGRSCHVRLASTCPWTGGGARTQETSCSSESYTEVQKLERPGSATDTGQIHGEVICGRIPIEFRSDSQSSSRLLFTTFPGAPGPK